MAFESLLRTLALFAFGAFLAFSWESPEPTPATAPSPEIAAVENASSTASIAEAPQSPPPPVAASSSPEKKAPPPEPKKTPVVAVPAPEPTVSLPPLPTSGVIGLDASASVLRDALVNFICYVPHGSGLRSISGSGVFIDPDGVILTNAHVALYYLLVDRGASCTIRTGSPARDMYKAEAIFISPSWITANAGILDDQHPYGTGEHDYALVAVTKAVNGASLPSAFPYIPLSQGASGAGTPVVIGSYGAQFLVASQIQASLFPTLVFGSVKDVYTFNTNTIDLLALGGSAAAQEGSSGGGVSDAMGELVGTLTTSTVEGSTDTRSLSAISATYIRNEYARETGNSLESLLSKPKVAAIADFASQISGLAGILSSN